jgi:hypothetical protein
MARLIELAPASQVQAPQIPGCARRYEPAFSRLLDPLAIPSDSLIRRRDNKLAALFKLTR